MCTAHKSTHEGAPAPSTPCSLCYGRGYLLVPRFDDSFGPSYTTEPCPKCQPYELEPIPWKVVGLGLAVLALVVWICLGGVR